jgi:hypothetical protein
MWTVIFAIGTMNLGYLGTNTQLGEVMKTFRLIYRVYPGEISWARIASAFQARRC